MAVVGASASALIAGSTGVPAVDKLLGIWESGLERETVPDRQGVGPGEVRPAEAGPTLVYGDQDGPAGEVTSFVSRSGQVCMVHSFEGATPGTVICEAPAVTERGLGTDGLLAFRLDVAAGKVAVFGQVAPNVESVSVTGPVGPMPVELGKTWGADTVPNGMRPFVAYAPVEATGMSALRWMSYSFEVERDGVSTAVAPR